MHGYIHMQLNSEFSLLGYNKFKQQVITFMVVNKSWRAESFHKYMYYTYDPQILSIGSF